MENPDVLAKAQKEIDKVIGFDRPPELGDLEDLPYIQAVINEVFSQLKADSCCNIYFDRCIVIAP